MNSKALVISLVTGVTLLSGCSTTSQHAVRPETTSKIHTVALIKVSEPATYVANDFGNPGAAFGAIGGAVAGVSSANAGKTLQQITQENGFAAGEALTRSLQEKLVNSGYQVKLISVEREKPGKLLEDYSNVDAAGADAIMDVTIETIGYATEHPMFSPHWRPASTVYVALIDSRTGEKLYAEKFMYGYHNPFMSGTDIEAPSTYHFKSKDSLFADSKKLIAGIEDSITTVSSNVATKLDK